MVAQLNHRSTRNLQFNVNYTWAKAMDYNQYIGTGSPANNVVEPASNLRAEYGRSPNDVRDRFMANMVWSPTSAAAGWRKALINGWGISPIFQAQSGLPFTLGG